MRITNCSYIFCVAALLGGCNSTPQPDLFPLNSGTRWVYGVVTEVAGETSRAEQTLEVTGKTDVAGTNAVIRRDHAGVEYAIRVDASGIARVAVRRDLDLQFTPDAAPRYVLKYPIAKGSVWQAETVPYTVVRKNEFPRELRYVRTMRMTYTIEAVDDKVTVSAGRFEGCVRVRGQADLKLYVDPVVGFREVPVSTLEWYCPGVGLVKVERDERLDSPFLSGGKITIELRAFSG